MNLELYKLIKVLYDEILKQYGISVNIILDDYPNVESISIKFNYHDLTQKESLADEIIAFIINRLNENKYYYKKGVHPEILYMHDEIYKSITESKNAEAIYHLEKVEQ